MLPPPEAVSKRWQNKYFNGQNLIFGAEQIVDY